MEPDETLVERLTLLENVHSLYFEPPVFLQPGETFWTEGRTLHIRAADGSVRSFVARPTCPEDVR